MSIRSINGIPINNISQLGETSYNAVDSFNGSPSAVFVRSNLIAFWDPSIVSSRGTILSGSTELSCSFNLTHHYTSSVWTTSPSGNFALFNGAYFRNFTTQSIVDTDTYYFDGVNDYGRLWTVANPAQSGNPSNINTLVNFTVEMWLRSDGNWVANGNWWSARANNGSRTRANDLTGQLYFLNPNMNAGQTLATTLPRNVWNHYVITMANVNATNDRLTAYINGSQVFQDTTGNYVPGNTLADFIVAAGGTSATLFSEFQRMYVGIIRRYNTELTSTQVSQNYNAERARYGR
jgi:hypothetical protein